MRILRTARAWKALQPQYAVFAPFSNLDAALGFFLGLATGLYALAYAAALPLGLFLRVVPSGNCVQYPTQRCKKGTRTVRSKRMRHQIDYPSRSNGVRHYWRRHS